MRQSKGQPARHWGHYNFWMLYGLLQQGRRQEARELLLAAYDEAVAARAEPDDPMELDPDRSQVGSLVQMWARYMIETRGTDDKIARWKFRTGKAYDPQLTFHYMNSLGSAYREDSRRAVKHLEKFRKLQAELRAAILAMERQAPTDLLYLDRLGIMELEMQSMIAMAGNELDQAVVHASQASRLEGEMPFSFGPPFVDLPSAELLGGLLIKQGKFDQAADAFELQLQRSKLKTLSLKGLAYAQQQQGKVAEAAHTNGRLQNIQIQADQDLVNP
jgi:hypothetical protein